MRDFYEEKAVKAALAAQQSHDQKLAEEVGGATDDVLAETREYLQRKAVS